MWNSGNWRSQASRIAWILSFGCFDMGTILSRFSSTKSRTNICKRWSVIYLSYILQVFVCYPWKESQPMCKNWCCSCYLKRNIFIVLYLNRIISETSTTYVFRSVWTTCAQSTFVHEPNYVLTLKALSLSGSKSCPAGIFSSSSLSSSSSSSLQAVSSLFPLSLNLVELC